MLQLNGIVGGNSPISVGAGKTILLQQILIPGDLSPHKVLVNHTTGEDLLIFLLVSALNKAKNSRALGRSDSWRMTLVRR